MEKLKQFPAAQKRLVCILLALICMLGLLPSTAFAAGPNTIVMEDCTHNGVYYESAALSTCWLHQMKFDYNGDTVMGFCADHGGGMGWSLEGHEWNNPREITDPTVKTMLAYFYAHSRGIFTDQARALGVDEVWSSDYTWTMNAWVQAVVWRYQENLFSDPVAACAEELLYVYNNLEHTNYTSIDDVVDGTTLRDRAQYILDLGAQGVWGDCKVYEYDYAGPGSAQHPAYDVQSIIIGDLTVTRERYQMTVKKVDATNPNLALPGARFLVQNANGTFSQEVVTGSDGTVTITNLEASTYSVTELDPPDNYQIDNAGPQYVVLPSATGETTATVTFTDTPIRTGEGSIRKVDADDPTKGLAGAVIKIEGVDNEFVGTYITGAGGYLEDVPWDAMPIGSFVASEVTPPNGYTTSSDPDKVRQEFYWDGTHDVDLIFENDAKVKVQLIKLDDSDDPIEGAVFNVVKDGQVVATEATDADGSIIVPNVTEGMYAFFEVSVPAPYAKLQQPVIAHVDQATVDGGGTVTVTAVDQMLPTLTILKRDGQTGEVVPGAVFEITGIHYGYHMDVTTGPDGTATLTGLPVDSYEVTEISVPDPYVVAAEPTQTIWLGPGDDRQLIFDNLKQPELTIAKVDAADSTTPIPGTVFRIEAIDGDYQHDVTTGQDGTVTLRVQPGTYKITELSVPAPYYLPDKDADREQTITLNAGDDKEVTFKDHKAPELTIYKVDSIAGAPVEGARFHVTYASNGEAADAPATIDYGEIVTDANGEIKLHEQGQRLYPGEFTIEEVEPAPGFQMKEPTRQTVILHGGESKTVRFENTPLNAIIVEKYDSVTGEALAGATFQLRFLGGTSGTGGTIIGQKVTGQNGTAIWTGLTAGTYILEEVDPADGYSIIQSSETVYLADSGEQSVITVRFQNMPDGILLVRKVCATNPSVTLPNAEFKVTYADGTLIGDSNGIFRTDENGEIRIEGLAPGKSVIVTEVSAPPGYIIDTQSQTVQIKEGRTVTLTFKNQPKGELIIQKRDSATKQPLPGAEFRVTTAAGCEVGLDGVIGDSTLTQNGIFTTDSNGEIRITNLAPGAYVISEIRSPSGYVMDAPSTNVVIGEGGDTQTVVITNSKAGSLVIDKRDSLTGEPLEGVTFKVTTSTGEFVPDENGYISSNGLYKTDKDGKIQIDGVVGTLVVTEVETIPGYTIDPAHQTQTVQVNPNDTQTLYFMQVMALRLRMRGVQCYILAPLKGHEFKRACHKIGGTYIKLAPGSSACINVMEIRPTLTPEMELIDELDYSDIDSMLAKKIQQLMIFFSLLIPDMSNEEEQLLDEALVKTYANFGITHDNSSIYEDPGSGKVKTMPILGDLYEVLKESPLTARLATIVSRFVTGSAQSFNRQSNINLSNRYVVLDISELKGKMLPVGMMIALDYVWDQVKADRTKKKMVFIDEIWKLIGGSANRQAAEFCLEIFKIIRGYGGGAVAATQDLSDFFGLEDGRYGRSILNNSKTKIILNLEPDEAEYVKDVLKLTRTEIRSITQFERGEALISSNSNKVPVIIKASREEQQMITTDRAELEAMLNELKAVADTAEAAAVPDGEAAEDSRGQALS